MWLDLSYYSGHHSCWALEHFAGGVLQRVNLWDSYAMGILLLDPCPFHDLRSGGITP